MRNHSTAAEALILNARSVSAAVCAKKKGRSDVAAAWVEQAINAGLDPIMRQEPLNGEDAGEWRLVTRKLDADHPRHPGALPVEHIDEVLVVLETLGRLRPDGEFKPWHGSILPDDSSPRAVALRVRLAREALLMDPNAFYRACGANPKAGNALEAGNGSFACIDNPMLADICAQHRIPAQWIMFGDADEIEA
jgi:hypothetical protein